MKVHFDKTMLEANGIDPEVILQGVIKDLAEFVGAELNEFAYRTIQSEDGADYVLYRNGEEFKGFQQVTDSDGPMEQV